MRSWCYPSNHNIEVISNFWHEISKEPKLYVIFSYHRGLRFCNGFLPALHVHTRLTTFPCSQRPDSVLFDFPTEPKGNLHEVVLFLYFSFFKFRVLPSLFSLIHQWHGNKKVLEHIILKSYIHICVYDLFSSILCSMHLSLRGNIIFNAFLSHYHCYCCFPFFWILKNLPFSYTP